MVLRMQNAEFRILLSSGNTGPCLVHFHHFIRLLKFAAATVTIPLFFLIMQFPMTTENFSLKYQRSIVRAISYSPGWRTMKRPKKSCFFFSFHSPFPNLFCYRHAVPFTSGWRILVILIASIHGQRHVSLRPPSICQRTIVLFTKHGSNFAKQRAGAALSNTTQSWKIYTAICHPFRARCAF